MTASRETVPAFAAGLRHGTFSVVEGAGHYVPLERPAQLTVILREAITQLSSYP
jgi:pimeloyl-ACP methyl ester carboxylesterase